MSANKYKYNDAKIKLYMLFFLQFFLILGFAVLYSSFIFILTSKYNVSEQIAYILLSKYFYLNFTFAVISGLIGRKLGFLNLVIYSFILQIVGFSLFYLYDMEYIYLSLSLIAIGTGFVVPSINMLISENSTTGTKQSNIILNYGFMNIGFFVGFILSSYYESNSDYSHLLLYTIIGLCLGLILAISTSKVIKKHSQELANSSIKYTLFSLMAIVTSYLIFIYDVMFKILIAFSVVWICLFIFKLFNSSKNNKSNVIGYIVMLILGLIFWSFYYLIPFAISLYVKNTINLSLYGIDIQPQMFNAMNTIIVVIASLLFALRIKKRLTQKYYIQYFIYAFVLQSVAFLVLSLSINFNSGVNFIGSSPFPVGMEFSVYKGYNAVT